MKNLHWIAFAAATAVLVVGSSVGMRAEAKPNCVRAGGTATMITEDLAKYMATAALNNSISNMGAKAAGKVSMTCGMNMGMPSCTARQKACKS